MEKHRTCLATMEASRPIKCPFPSMTIGWLRSDEVDNIVSFVLFLSISTILGDRAAGRGQAKHAGQGFIFLLLLVFL